MDKTCLLLNPLLFIPKAAVYTSNPFVYGSNGDEVTSSVYKLSVGDSSGSANVTSDNPVTLGFPNINIATSTVNQTLSPQYPDTLLYHKVNVTSSSSSLIVNLMLEGDASIFRVFISKRNCPNTTHYDVNKTTLATVTDGRSEVNVVVRESELSGAGIYCIGLRPISK